MKRVMAVVLLAVLAATVFPIKAEGHKYRVTWKSSNGTVWRTPWSSKDTAVQVINHTGSNYFLSARYGLERQRKFLFIPLPARQVAPDRTYRCALRKPNQEAVTFRLAEWKAGPTQKAKYENPLENPRLDHFHTPQAAVCNLAK